MTPIHTYANPPTREGRTARVSASARPIPRAPANDREPTGRHDPLWATVIARARLTATILALLAAVVLAVTAPPAVTIPLATVLVTGLFFGGLFLLIERFTRPTDPADGATIPTGRRTRRGS